MGPLPQLALDENNLELEIPFNILDNQIHELNKFFIVRLSSTDTDVVLNPQETRVRLADNDGIYISSISFMFINYLLLISC